MQQAFMLITMCFDMSYLCVCLDDLKNTRLWKVWQILDGERSNETHHLMPTREGTCKQRAIMLN